MAQKEQTAADQSADESKLAEPQPQLTLAEGVGVGDENTVHNGGNAADDAPEPASTDERENEHEEAPYGYLADGVTPAKKRGPKPKSDASKDEKAKQRSRLRSVSPGKGLPQKVPTIGADPLAVVNYQAMGEMCSNLFVNLGVMVLGKEWEPDDQGELLALSAGFRDYLKATGAKDLPPGFALTAIVSVYIIKRAARPTIGTKLKVIGGWFKDKLSIFRRR